MLLSLHFPRLRIIWSSSPYATAEIFSDLKLNETEPDPSQAVSIGADDDPHAGEGTNTVADEVLRALPGINAKNVKHVMGKVNSVKELCGLDLQSVQDILGIEPGRACWDFIHHGERENN